MSVDCELYGTLGCHLCEEAEQVLQPFVAQGLVVELLDIIDSPEWLEPFRNLFASAVRGKFIPVSGIQVTVYGLKHTLLAAGVCIG